MIDVGRSSLMHQTLAVHPPRELPRSARYPPLDPPTYRSYPPPSALEAGATPDLVPSSLPHDLPIVAVKGLPYTPPPDMSGPQLGAVLPSSYGSHPIATLDGDAVAAVGAATTRAPSPPLSTEERFSTGRSRTLHRLDQMERFHGRPPSPISRRTSRAMAEPAPKTKPSASGSIVPSLQIPATINDSKGSLGDFAAQITCLFWFETFAVLQRVEESKTSPYPVAPLVSEAVPSLGFRKWVTTILSTTQVTQNVILLALLFICRLKKLNPTVKGKAGSEFRLMTVALMLGNKFLDDNTYTNKTWAEVSGISVHEIHIMEVEFLSNMRYSLYTSQEEWLEWHSKLGRFWDYFDKASRAPVETMPRPLAPPLPGLGLPTSLPSPPASNHASPPFVSTYTPNDQIYPYSLSFPPHLAPSVPSPATSGSDVGARSSVRKRSHDGGTEPPQPKRSLRSHQQSSAGAYPPSLAPSYLQNITSHVPRLPAPSMSYSAAPSAGAFPNSAVAQLPIPAGRAMSMVFNPSVPAAWAPPSHTHPLAINSHDTSSGGNYCEAPRRPVSYPATMTSSSSPTNSLLPGPVMSQAHASPSYFLTHRNSPYRPVRRVSTLLVSPPAGAVQNAPQNLGLDQMHYQPLGKSRGEFRTGVVPYVNHDTWVQSQHTPHWPSLPRPNFHQ